MKLFVAASYSSKVDYSTGHVLPEYKTWLEENLSLLESWGHTVFCALREDSYIINDSNPAEAFKLDVRQIESSDAIVAFVDSSISAGVQTEIGYGLALGKKAVFVRRNEDKLAWFNQAIIQAGQASEAILPLTTDPLV